MSDDLTPAAAIRAFVFSPTATPPQTPPATPAPTAPFPSMLVQPTAPITASQATTMAGWIKEELAKGKMTQADADKAFSFTVIMPAAPAAQPILNNAK